MVLLMLVLAGCASADRDCRQLNQQQMATIGSLNAEVLRLNQELEDRVASRDLLESVVPELKKGLAGEVSSGDVAVLSEPRGLVLRLSGNALFEEGTTQLRSSSEEILDRIAAILAQDLPKNRVTVEGHTDDRQVEGAEGVTNWEFSIGMGTAVLHYLIDAKNLAPERFEISGNAEYRPVTSNKTEAGRNRNQRVDIVISPEKIIGVTR